VTKDRSGGIPNDGGAVMTSENAHPFLLDVYLQHNNKAVRVNFLTRQALNGRPYPGIAPGGYSIHYTNTIPNLYPGANPG